MKVSHEEVFCRVVFYGDSTIAEPCILHFYQIVTGEIYAYENSSDAQTLQIPAFEIPGFKIGNRNLNFQFVATPGTAHPMYFPVRLLLMKAADAIVICLKGDETIEAMQESLSQLTNLCERLGLISEKLPVMILFASQVDAPDTLMKKLKEELSETGITVVLANVYDMKNRPAALKGIITTVRRAVELRLQESQL